MKLKYLITAIAATLVSTPVFATDAGEGYVGGQLSMTTYDEAGLDDVNPTAIIGRLGYFVVDNFAIEGRFGTGIGDDSTLGVDVEIDSIAGIYGVGHLPLGDVASAYAVAGFSRGEASFSAPGFSNSDDDTDFSYGVGLQAKFAPTLSGHVEYMSYLDKTDYEFTAIGLGLNYHF
ncbi:porin family protein [Vreelandella aquamarina]|uniref:porin family protein n=1 Tax=Vreelandella aquamarina TaxID=77097 RepID=UPI00384FDD29